MHRVYMDANATTPLLPEVLEAMRPYWMEDFGNASSIYVQGQTARRAVGEARETLAAFFNCREAEVIFNSGGTEGDNTAIFGLLRAGDHLITTAIEHSAVLRAAERMGERGVDVTYIAPQPNGLIDPDAIRSALDPRTRLISVMLANNETGVLQPVEEIGKIAAEARVFFHIDAVQGAGKVPVRREAVWVPSALHQRAQDARTQGRGRDVCAPRNAAGAADGGRQPRAPPARRNGECARHRGPGQGRGAGHGQPRGWNGGRVAALRDRLEAGILKIAGTGVNGARTRRARPTRPTSVSTRWRARRW